MLRSDIFISRTSTSIEESIISGVPSAAYLHNYPKDIIKRLHYLDSDACCVCFNKSDLFDLLLHATKSYQQLFNDFILHRKVFLQQFYSGYDSSFQRISELVDYTPNDN